MYIYTIMSKTQRDTPNWLAKKIGKMCLNQHLVDLTQVNILEPSAGTGKLLEYLPKNMYCKLQIVCVELNEDKCKILKEKGFHTIHGNFLAHKFDKTFDLVVAAPPFKNNIDLLHITKMYSLLNPGGMIVTLTTPYWTVNNEIHQVEFREFLKDKQHLMEMLPDNTFMEKRKTVSTALLTIYKPY